MSPGKLGSALAAGVFFCGVGAVNAATIVQDVQFDYDNTATSFSFNQFNPALGTLTGVSLDLLNSVFSLTSTINYSGGASGDFVYASYLAQFANLVTSGGTILANTVGEFLNSCSVPISGGTGCSATQGPFTATGATGGPVSLTPLADYDSGPAPTFSPSFPNLAIEGPMVVLGNGTVSLSNDVTWSGTWELTYTYTPAVTSDVPEASTWTMMLTGFAGLAFARRRKARAASASA